MEGIVSGIGYWIVCIFGIFMVLICGLFGLNIESNGVCWVY